MTALYLLNKNQEVFHIIPDQDILELWDTDGINALNTVEGSIRTTVELQEKLTEASYYAIPEPNTDNLFSIYKHLSMETTNQTINIFGLQLGFDELKSMGYIKDYRPQNRTITEVVNTILADTGWEIGFVDTRIPNITSTFYYLNKLDALSQLIELTGCEVDFKVSITGKRISMKYINVYIQMGENTGKRFVYGTNALEIVKEHDTAELYTAILGRGKGEETENGGFGRRITFKEVVWTKASGKPLDKPLNQEYLEIPEATAQYGYPNGKPRILIKEYEEIEDKNELIQATYEDLKVAARPKVQFKSTVVNTGDLKKGDTVTIVRYDLNIKYQTRVFKVKRNRLNNLLSQIELGDVIVDSPAKKQADFTKNLTNRIEQIINQVNNVSVIAGDGTKVNYGPDQPSTAKVGDLWYEQLLNGKTNLRKWNGTEWGILVNDLTGEEVKAEVSAMVAGIAIEKTRVDNAVAKADKAITDSGFAKLDATGAKASALEAFNLANTAKTNSETALTTSQNSLTSSIDALAKAGQALDKATATEVTTGKLTTSYDALTKTVALKADSTELNTVKGTVTQHGLDISANATAVGLKADKTLVNTIKGTVDKHTLDIKAGADGLLLKADSTLVNTIKVTVDSQGLAITAAANGLTLKADTSVVNTIKGTVDTHTNQIKVVSDGMALKAESSLVNTINGTVNTHTNQIAANSTAISARLTSAQVDSLVTGKGYATTTALNATSNTLSASIVEVSTDLSNLGIGVRNYFTKTNIFSQLTLNSDFSPRDIDTPNGFRVTGNPTETGGVRLHKVITENGWWTVSFDIKGSQSAPIGVTVDICDSGMTRVITNTTNTYKRVSVSVWVSNYSTVYNFVDFEAFQYAHFWINNIKVEKGNKATDWTPAPEDMATVERAVQIEANLNGLQTTVSNKAEQTQVTQLANQISTKVESATYNSKMTQLDNAINLRVSKANIVTEINLSAETSTVRIAGKRIQLDGDVAMDNAFVNQIKAIEVIADKITSGTFNGANMNIINLNAKSMTSGTFTGANFGLNLDTGTATFTNPSNGDSLIMNQGLISFYNGVKSRHLAYTDEGLKIYAGTGNTGTSANTSIQLIGGHAYLEFISSVGGYYQRIEAMGGDMYISHSPGRSLRVRTYGGDEQQSKIIAGRYSTTHSSGQILELYANSLSTPNDGNRSIYLVPNGTGSIVIGNAAGTRWNIQASDFVKVSSRATKTNIVPLDNGLNTINSLLAVTYNKIDKINRGIIELEKGFIAEDSPSVSTPDGKGIYDSFIVAHLVKGMQELDARTASETDILKSRVTKLEQKIKLLESAA